MPDAGCPRCGALNAAGARFCSSCGAALVESSSRSFTEQYGSLQPPAPAPPPVPRRTSPLVFLGLAVAVVAVVGYVLLTQYRGIQSQANTLATTAASFISNPTPEVTLPPVLANFGTIDFGTAVNTDTLTITKGTATFSTKYTGKVCWVAHLSEGAGATSLTFAVTSRSSGGSETTLIATNVAISNPAFDTLSNCLPLAAFPATKPGTYVMRYVREAKVLAEGDFTVK
jgi:hypothetical protein